MDCGTNWSSGFFGFFFLCKVRFLPIFFGGKETTFASQTRLY